MPTRDEKEAAYQFDAIGRAIRDANDTIRELRDTNIVDKGATTTILDIIELADMVNDIHCSAMPDRKDIYAKITEIMVGIGELSEEFNDVFLEYETNA